VFGSRQVPGCVHTVLGTLFFIAGKNYFTSASVIESEFAQHVGPRTNFNSHSEVYSAESGSVISYKLSTPTLKRKTYSYSIKYVYIHFISTEQSTIWEANSSSPGYGTPRFIIVFTTARQWTLPWTIWIQSTRHFSKIHLNICRLSTPQSPQMYLPFSFSDQNFYAFITFFTPATCSAKFILLDLITLTIFADASLLGCNAVWT
jgi:hypothetical protein